MNRKLLIGIAAGVLALMLAGGAVFAGELPIGQRSATAQATSATARPNAAGPRQGDRQAKRAMLVRAMVQATADATGTQPKDVLAALQDGKSLAQYAQEHGKTGDDILAKLREQGNQRLDKALERAKQLIDQPGLGRGTQPNNAGPNGGTGERP
jgi:hypothetical protein